MADENCRECEGVGELYDKETKEYKGICLECGGIGYISAFGKGVK